MIYIYMYVYIYIYIHIHIYNMCVYIYMYVLYIYIYTHTPIPTLFDLGEIFRNHLPTLQLGMVQKRSGLVGVGQHRRPSDLQIFHTYGIILFRNVPNVQSLLTLQLNSISILFHLLSMFSFDVSSLSFPPVFSAPGNFWTGPGVRCAASIIRRPVRWTPPRWLRPSEIASAASAAAQKFLNIQGGPLDPLDPLDHGSLSISIISIIFI